MAARERVGVYPGTFDPITLGHLDIIRRAAHLVDRLVIGVTTNPSKEPMFSVAERMDIVRRETADIAGVTVVEFDSLLMDFAESQGASLILRGLRAVAAGLGAAHEPPPIPSSRREHRRSCRTCLRPGWLRQPDRITQGG